MKAELVTLDDRFSAIAGDEYLERLYDAGRWLEGPVYIPAWRSLVFSDIPNDRLLRWDEESGQVSVFRAPSGNVNGNTLDTHGRLISCSQGNRQVVRTEYDGSLTVLASHLGGSRLNSPNDVVVKRDGSIWFTDPPYGITSNYEGHRAEQEVGGCHVYRISPDGELTVVADDFVRPNGLAFSRDETQLYVVDTPEKHIRRFDVKDDGLTGGEVFAPCTAGRFDGIRLDAEGRVWAATHEGVHVFDADGTLLGKLLLPDVVSNLCFGGPKRNRLFVTATTSVWSWLITTDGARPPYDHG
ncbi:SMP-30/gluconolactonase/LRE family protein [Kribbella italica]|uniref:Gluconolactonase n=1 Tax=Kribbella italica TaxID=1540520 RepID=A0A7W9JFN3_9ACTN|nr:SMP-30/gluconolactonase/LRE family protein [Kribbella italica]MBB5840940.1 gluconolactonase [Kribbella italica]